MWGVSVSVVQRMGERIPHIRAISHLVEKSILIRISRSPMVTIDEFACEFTLRKASNQRRVQKMFNILLRVITMSDIMRSVEGMLRETKLLNINININMLVRYYSVWSVQRLIKHKNAKFAYSLINWEHETGYDTRHHHLRLKWRPKGAAVNNCWLIQSVSQYTHFMLFRTNWFYDKEAKKNLKTWLLRNYPKKI